MKPDDKLPWLKAALVKWSNGRPNHLMMCHMSTDKEPVQNPHENGYFIPAEQAQALFQGAKIILEYEQQRIDTYRGRKISRPEPVEYAFALLWKGIG